MRLFLTLTVFILTLILMLTRPRGLHEAWATCLGGSLMLLLGLETPVQAWHTTAQGADVLAFLLALMLLSGLLDRSGFFEWAALHAARAAKGNGEALFRNVFLLGAVVTALLSLDTTAIILTPVVLAFVGRLKLRARPFLLACAFVANTASLLLPVSNLTNLLFQSAFHFTFGAFVLRMALPQATALAVNYLVFRRLFRRELPQAFPTDDLPTPGSVLPDGPYFRGALVALACVLVGYFIGSLRGVPPCVVALAGCVGLAAWGVARHQVKWDVWRDVSWSLFPFVIGLFVVIRGVENLGLTQFVARELGAVGQDPLAVLLASTFGTGAGSNVINNVPMALLAISTLKEAHAGPFAQYGALLGCNLGPNLTLTGSLATMLVISGARKKGEDVRASDFFRAGLWTTPAMLLSASLTLWLALKL